MKVKLTLLDGKTLKNNFTIPSIFEGKGEYALELVLTKVVEIYYGTSVRIRLEDLLKTRLSDEEIAKNFTIYQERKK